MGNVSFRFNNGKMTLICPNCEKEIKTGEEMTKEEWDALEGGLNTKSIYCEDCKDKEVNLDTIDTIDSSNLGPLKDILPILSNDPEFRENLIKVMSEKMSNNIKFNDEK